MSSENKENFKIEYQKGKAAFERGDYRLAIQRLLAAITSINRNSPLGGEAQIWLVTAYEAAGQKSEAIALCQQLNHHPDLETRKQAKNLLYILQAPQLKRPAEWMIKIPDLGTLAESEVKTFVSSPNRSKRKPQKPAELDSIEPSQINTKDNQFVWVALVVLALIVVGLIGFGV